MITIIAAIAENNALGKDNQWVVENGILRSPRPGSNTRSVKTFDDFKDEKIRLFYEIRLSEKKLEIKT